MRALLLAALLVGACAAHAEPATERYAPAQLRVAQEMLARARAAALRGDAALAGKFAWQASLDARLTWAMSESALLRAEAAQVAGTANLLLTRVAGAR